MFHYNVLIFTEYIIFYLFNQASISLSYSTAFGELCKILLLKYTTN